MVLHDAETELSFIVSFDAGRFPYDDQTEASKLIGRGWAISLNATFCVLNELCRLPHDGACTIERARELVAEWATGPDHPLKAPLLRAANALIDDESIPWPEGVQMMRQVAEFDGQRAALGIAYFSSDCASAEGDRELTAMEAGIRAKWENMGI